MLNECDNQAHDALLAVGVQPSVVDLNLMLTCPLTAIILGRSVRSVLMIGTGSDRGGALL